MGSVIVLPTGAASTTRQGLTQFEGISAESAGARALCAHLLEIPPGGRAKAHRHAGHETAIYVMEGRAVLWFGEELESRVDVGPGDFLYIPLYVPHLPANASNTEWARGVVARTDPNEQESVPVLGNPANRNRAIPLTYDQFRYAFANAVSEEEAKQLYETYAVATAGKPLFQAAAANLNPWTEAKVDTKNPERGPLLIISGEMDHTVPPAVAKASYKQQQDNDGVTEITEMKNRGTRPHHRQRLARSGRNRPRLHQKIREVHLAHS